MITEEGVVITIALTQEDIEDIRSAIIDLDWSSNMKAPILHKILDLYEETK
jgi:hypothetical protein